MKFSIFKSPKAQKGELCTRQLYVDTANAPWLLRLCNDIAAETDADKRAELKKKLPVITWQAYFPGRRVNKEAEPSGLFMLDIDHVENPGEVWTKQIAGRLAELGIVYVGKTASRHGLRIVAKCLPTLHSLEECQKWLASNLKVEYDSCCKDWARCSFLVHDSYTYYMDAKAIWEDEPATGTVYAGGSNPAQDNAEMEALLKEADATPSEQPAQPVDQREGLFGGADDYNGIPYDRICKEWLLYTGGEPQKGERNVRLYKLATRLRYICDFNEAHIFKVIPRYDLPEAEVKQLVHSAMNSVRAMDMPLDLKDVLQRLGKIKALGETEDYDVADITNTDKMPALPPLFRQWAEIAPEDFKVVATLCQLPILGTLGSKLRARYLDGTLHSPSFQVSLEAPQASGKSFLKRLVDYELAPIMDSDKEQREKERAYNDRAAEMKMLNIKITVDNKDEILGRKPKGIIRYVPATMSITKMLMRMENAQGLHLFAYAEEIDTVLKAFKKSFSSYSDALRVSFDNGLYGQDYANENSFSGILPLYYNFLASGTPKAMRRFYPDVEDGLVSRVLFVTLPDQFGKKMPVWGEFNEKQRSVVDVAVQRLNDVSIQGDVVMPDHVMKMDWVNEALRNWILGQQQEAVKEDDRTRDIFCRRAAVVGFRAAMLAFFLYGEKNTPTIRRNVINFAIWVANNMLNQHLLRFSIKTNGSNVVRYNEVYDSLPDDFTREDLEKALKAHDKDISVKQVIWQWRTIGRIEVTGYAREEVKGKRISVKFKKL